MFNATFGFFIVIAIGGSYLFFIFTCFLCDIWQRWSHPHHIITIIKSTFITFISGLRILFFIWFYMTTCENFTFWKLYVQGNNKTSWIYNVVIHADDPSRGRKKSLRRRKAKFKYLEISRMYKKMRFRSTWEQRLGSTEISIGFSLNFTKKKKIWIPCVGWFSHS